MEPTTCTLEQREANGLPINYCITHGQDADKCPIDEWATARSGNARIRFYTLPAHLHTVKRGTFEVYALDGHELLPRTKAFKDEQEARSYANHLWATL